MLIPKVTVFLRKKRKKRKKGRGKYLIEKENIWLKSICPALFQQLNLDLVLNFRDPSLTFFMLLLVSIPPQPLSAHPLVDRSLSLLILDFMPPKRVLREHEPMLSIQTGHGNGNLLQRADTFTVFITLLLEAAVPEHPRSRQSKAGGSDRSRSVSSQ